MALPEEVPRPDPTGEPSEAAGEPSPCPTGEPSEAPPEGPPCPTCEGTGTTDELCTFCHATGLVYGGTCWVCKGKGNVLCPTCNGAGYLEPVDTPLQPSDPSDPSAEPSDLAEGEGSRLK